MVVRAAVQEDVHVVGVSILSGAHLTLLPRLRKLMDEKGLEEIPLVAGGVIPEEDANALSSQGVAAVFTPGTRLEEVVSYIRNAVGTNTSDQAVADS
jgi:methylmalonyl-CoA mutase C-terminal domain/subunit